MDNLIKQVRRCLIRAMEDHSITVEQLGQWCDVSDAAVYDWRSRGVPEHRVYQVAYHIWTYGNPEGDASGLRAVVQLANALKWYGDQTRYSAANSSAIGRPSGGMASPSVINVYRTEVLNDRGALARQVLREVGHE